MTGNCNLQRIRKEVKNNMANGTHNDNNVIRRLPDYGDEYFGYNSDWDELPDCDDSCLSMSDIAHCERMDIANDIALTDPDRAAEIRAGA